MNGESTPTQRVLGSLDEPTRSTLEKLLRAPLVDTRSLTDRVAGYADGLEQAVEHWDRFDRWTANIVERKCLALIEKLEEADEPGRRLIQAAALYFIEENDANGDTSSAVGFDDDLEVVDAVARELGFTDVLDMQSA